MCRCQRNVGYQLLSGQWPEWTNRLQRVDLRHVILLSPVIRAQPEWSGSHALSRTSMIFILLLLLLFE